MWPRETMAVRNDSSWVSELDRGRSSSKFCFILLVKSTPKAFHIFPKAQVAANKNAHDFRHHFLTQFFMLFHMVRSILFRVLALKNFKWKFLIGC